MVVSVPQSSVAEIEDVIGNINYVDVPVEIRKLEDTQQEDWKMAWFPGVVDVPKIGEHPSNRWVAQAKEFASAVDKSINRISTPNSKPKLSIAGDFNPKYYTPGPSLEYPSIVSPNNHTVLDSHLNANGRTDVKFNVKNAASNALTVPTKLGVIEAGLDFGNYLYENRDRIDDVVSFGEAIYDYGKSIIPSVIEFGKQVIDHVDTGDVVGLIRDAVDVTPVPTILTTLDNVTEVLTGTNPNTSGAIHNALSGESAVEVFTSQLEFGSDDPLTIKYVNLNDNDTFYEKASDFVGDVGQAIGTAVGTVIDTGAEIIGGAIDAVGGWVNSWKWW